MDPQPAGISREELQLAARNHGMPLEALRHEITPVGLHYLLVHYDIPAVGEEWSLRVDGRVRRPLELDLDAIRDRPSVTRPVTMECAGNGRATMEPHVASQPWILEAVGTGEWTGAPLAPLLEQAGLLDDAVEIVFEGLDRGLEGGDEQTYGRSLTIEQAVNDGAILAYQLNGAPLPSQHGYPLRLVVPGWYGMTNVKWLARSRPCRSRSAATSRPTRTAGASVRMTPAGRSRGWRRGR
jgi:DMSO/TMAO reductase YedYZ molybdopterin-dependent catalytic subunit